MHRHKYLERVNMEIDELITKEGTHMTLRGEEALHVLLENREHVMELIEEHKAGAKAATQVAKV